MISYSGEYIVDYIDDEGNVTEHLSFPTLALAHEQMRNSEGRRFEFYRSISSEERVKEDWQWLLESFGQGK